MTSGTELEKWPPLAVPFSDLIAGSMGGAAQVVVGQPLDTVKTRAQTSPRGMFKGPMDILTQTVRKEGFFALYKGERASIQALSGFTKLLKTEYPRHGVPAHRHRRTEQSVVHLFPDVQEIRVRHAQHLDRPDGSGGCTSWSSPECHGVAC